VLIDVEVVEFDFYYQIYIALTSRTHSNHERTEAETAAAEWKNPGSRKFSNAFSPLNPK
jgi:hypothetical protein